MNDTKLNSRQFQILDFLAFKPLSRLELEKLLSKENNISKITLLRDLDSLISEKLVSTQGRGKKTIYLSNQNPALRVIDIDKYFEENSEIRKSAKSEFDFKIFDNIKDLFEASEKENITKDSISFDERGKTIDPTLYKREIERFTVEFAWKSSKIEGNTYTLLETEALIKNAKEAVGHSRYEAIMILNHKKAIDFILLNKSYFKELTLKKVIKLHSILTNELEVTQGIREGAVAITGTVYVPLFGALKLKKALEETVKLINKADFPLEKALIASSMIAYIQGFNDGNKRTARTLANALLISNNYYPLSYRDIKESDYIKNLILFYEQTTLFGLKQLLVDQYIFSQENYFRIN
ncbi:MAG: Fic family protein [Candidatus Woesebacteria bacterium]|nr:Fic family protein [Candidatus Woesebacteria bacterium]